MATIKMPCAVGSGGSGDRYNNFALGFNLFGISKNYTGLTAEWDGECLITNTPNTSGVSTAQAITLPFDATDYNTITVTLKKVLGTNSQTGEKVIGIRNAVLTNAQSPLQDIYNTQAYTDNTNTPQTLTIDVSSLSGTKYLELVWGGSTSTFLYISQIDLA